LNPNEDRRAFGALYRQSLLNSSYDGITGNIRFDSNGDRLLLPYNLFNFKGLCNNLALIFQILELLLRHQLEYGLIIILILRAISYGQVVGQARHLTVTSLSCFLHCQHSQELLFQSKKELLLLLMSLQLS
jgi:hypothetical protein